MKRPVVEQGQIIIEPDEPHLVLAARRVQVWNIECASKYADITLGGSDDEVSVYLWADERTLRYDESTDAPTVVRFKRFGDMSLVDGGRYSWRLVMVDTRAPLWRRLAYRFGVMK